MTTLRAAYIENKGTFETSIMLAAKAAADSMGHRFSEVYYRSARDLCEARQSHHDDLEVTE